MTGPIIDYQAVLDDLYAKRAQIDAAIDGIRAVAALSGTPIEDQGGDASTASSAPASQKASRSPTVPQAAGFAGIANDTFFGMSTSEAIRKFLAMMKRPQSPRIIADAMVAGGQVHAVDAEVGYTNTYTALRRLLKGGVVVQIKSGDWGLAEWYGNKPKSQEGE